jgi:hypothetical protein
VCLKQKNLELKFAVASQKILISLLATKMKSLLVALLMVASSCSYAVEIVCDGTAETWVLDEAYKGKRNFTTEIKVEMTFNKETKKVSNLFSAGLAVSVCFLEKMEQKRKLFAENVCVCRVNEDEVGCFINDKGEKLDSFSSVFINRKTTEAKIYETWVSVEDGGKSINNRTSGLLQCQVFEKNKF